MITVCWKYMIIADFQRLKDPAYFEAICRQYAGADAARIHRHTCATCGRVSAHTRIEALRDGDIESHTCCSADVRKKESLMPVAQRV